jgi:hypothetical protein
MNRLNPRVFSFYHLRTARGREAAGVIFIKSFKQAFAYEVIDGHFKSTGDFFDSIDRRYK